jgi:hypothetical protein
VSLSPARINDLGGFENKTLVYENNPQKPIVISKATLNSRPFTYHEYLDIELLVWPAKEQVHHNRVILVRVLGFGTG